MPTKTTVLGVDPSTKKIAIAGTQTRLQREPEFWSIRLPVHPIIRCGTAFGEFGALLYDLTQRDGEPPRVYLEAPILARGGPHATIVQAQVGGAIMAACVEYRAPLVMVNNSSWKKQVLGNGNLDKTKIAAELRRVWPEAWELADGNQDLIDAAAINKYGRNHTELIRRLRILRRQK